MWSRGQDADVQSRGSNLPANGRLRAGLTPLLEFTSYWRETKYLSLWSCRNKAGNPERPYRVELSQMAIYLVMAMKETQAPEMASQVERVFPEDSHYVVAPDKWFVSTEISTARQVAEKLGIIGSKSVSGIVVSVGGYSGRAQPDVWEWLAAKLTKDG